MPPSSVSKQKKLIQALTIINNSQSRVDNQQLYPGWRILPASPKSTKSVVFGATSFLLRVVDRTIMPYCIVAKVTEGHHLVLGGKPAAMSRSPPNQNGTMAKGAWWVRKVYWRRERAHDKAGERVEFVVCTAGVFIGCVDKVKCE